MSFPHAHLLDLAEYSFEDVRRVLDLAREVKADPDACRARLAGKTLAMVFEKPSTRTRVSFEVGISQLGGSGLYLGRSDLQIGRGESIPDTARVLSRYVDGVMARVFSHQTLVDLAAHATVPIINGLSDLLHPCQALADFQTIEEHKGALAGVEVAYVGDGNNVLHSLANMAALVGANLRYATPPGYEPDEGVIAAARARAAAKGATVTATHDPVEAVRGADVIYADVWTSMGQEGQEGTRNQIFEPYQINAALVQHARRDYLFMHCLPAHRGEEVTDEICDSPNSVIFDEAENRLHAQKAVMLLLMGE
jgi:ornithine carbamoyltransferase